MAATLLFSNTTKEKVNILQEKLDSHYSKLSKGKLRIVLPKTVKGINHWLSTGSVLVKQKLQYDPKKSTTKEDYLLIEEYTNLLLKDFSQSLLNKPLSKQVSENFFRYYYERIKDIAVIGIGTVVGTVYLGLEAFDTITYIVGYFTTHLGAIIISAGVFVGLSLVIFFVCQLFELIKKSHLKVHTAPSEFDIYLRQISIIKTICQTLINNAVHYSLEELREYEALMVQLIQRYQALGVQRQIMQEHLSNPWVIFTDLVVAFLRAIPFFGAGWLVGQGILVGGIFAASVVTATIIPTGGWGIVLCLAIGICAFLYCFIFEQSYNNPYLWRCFGLKKEKIEMICDPKVVEQEMTLLSNCRETLGFFASAKQGLQENNVTPGGEKRDPQNVTPSN